jgi:hypothetical protein
MRGTCNIETFWSYGGQPFPLKFLRLAVTPNRVSAGQFLGRGSVGGDSTAIGSIYAKSAEEPFRWDVGTAR